MEWLLGVSSGLLAYTYLGYPLLAGALARLWPRPHWLAPIEPTVALVIVAHNAERVLEAKLQNALALDYPRAKLEILVASDGSTDRTEAIAEGFATRGVALLRVADKLGRTETANRAAEQTRGEILVFSDATGQYNRSALRALVRHFADPEVGAASGRVALRHSSAPATVLRAAPRMPGQAWGTELRVTSGICAVRRENFAALPPHLDFDLAHPLHAALAGRRTVYESDAISTAPEREDAPSEFEASVRRAEQAYAFAPYLLARLLRCRSPIYLFQMISRELLRWLAPLALVALFAASCALAVESRPVALLLVLQLAGYAASTLTLLRPPPLGFVAIQLAFLLGFGRWLLAALGLRARPRA